MDKKFFFIRGYQRSGTNWVKAILNLHPKIFCRGEFHFANILYGINKFVNANSLTCQFNDIVLKHFELMVKECLCSKINEQNKPNILWFGENSPWNFNRYKNRVLIKDVRYIIIGRDGRDILVSRTYHRLRHLYEGHLTNEFKQVLAKYPFILKKLLIFKDDISYFDKNPTELLDSEFYVKEEMKDWINHIKMQNNWLDKVRSDYKEIKIHFLKYEDLWKKIEIERKKLYQFLELVPTEAAELSAGTKPGFNRINNLSHFRKGIVGDWKNYFTEQVCNWVKEIAGKTLIDLGYEKNFKWHNKIQ